MKVMNIRFLKDGKPSGRAYAYRVPEDINPGDTVLIDVAKKGIVSEETVDEKWIETYGKEKLKEIVGKVVEQ